MGSVSRDARHQAYWEAIRRRVCSVCLDGADDGGCGLTPDRNCAIEVHLPQLLQIVFAVKSGRMDEYVHAVEEQICTQCTEKDAQGRCPLRLKAECALSVYMPLVLEAVEEVDAERAERT